ncbi:substrate-binding domain-containing protein [Roseateles sp. BYS180W]|uniref:Substrate-binding domain-containing protein n=1 Tax=Roseateles rivi TaxID=3299028 RepID=A0ABW7FU59_9BURK
MKQVSIRPVWTIQGPSGPPLPARLIELLVQVSESGSLLLASRALALSYRHAWDLVRQGEAVVQAPLLQMERGRGSTLTALGARIVWADKRIRARLTPALESLSWELAQELEGVLNPQPAALRLHASHGFAIECLIERMAAECPALSFQWASSTAVAAALRQGDCDIAGMHLPHGAMQEGLLRAYAPWLQGLPLTLVDIATRRQGLMVRAGNPKEIYTLGDLARPEVRFVNRQSGSGTRLLLEGLLREQDIKPTQIAGYEHSESTHAAVAACVASGLADVGFGLEPPARQFKLEFVPIATERYFLLCRNTELQGAQMQAIISALRDPAFRHKLSKLPGYDTSAAGTITPLEQAYPLLG